MWIGKDVGSSAMAIPLRNVSIVNFVSKNRIEVCVAFMS